MIRLTLAQKQNNADSRDQWQQAGLHRERVMALVDSAVVGQDTRLCVLGAGNCHDLDLARLCEQCAEVHLVDLDTDALTAALERQGVSDRPEITLHGDCDLTGIWPQLERWSPDRPTSDAEVDELITAANDFAGLALPGPFDTVVSACLLSQLINAVVVTLGEKHPRFVDAIRAVRHRHLQLLIELTAPGGTGILVTDVVSSDTAPELPWIEASQLSGYVSKLIRSGNFFHGLNPKVIRTYFEKDPEIAAHVAAIEFVPPWLWDFGSRHYVVVAVKFRRV
jgi:hypothetical protein